MQLWPVEYFLAIFVISFGWVQQQTLPKLMTKMVKKFSTGPSYIRKEVTSYKIHTLTNKRLPEKMINVSIVK